MLMPRIDRYILRQLSTALIAVTGGLVALIWLTQSLRFVELVVNRGLSLAVFLKLTSLLIPGFVAVVLPITCFVVVQFVYQRLAGDRELTVMRTAGLSQWALSRPAIMLTIIAIGCGYALNLYIVPASMTAFREFQFEIRNRIAAFLLQDGVFTSISDDLLVYVRAREPDGSLHGILIDDARDHAHRATILAENGRLLDGPNGPQVLLQNGDRQELDTKTGGLNVVSFRQSTLDLTQPHTEDPQRLRDMGEMTLSELQNPVPGTFFERDLPRMRVEAQRRMANPLATWSYVMVALTAVLGGSFRRFGGLLRQFVAIMTVVALVALGLALDSLAVRYPMLIPLIWVRALLPGLVCVIALFAPALMPGPVRSAFGVR